MFYRIIVFNGKVWFGVNICVGGLFLGVLFVLCFFYYLWDILKDKNEYDRIFRLNVVDFVFFK